jgi:hypothetical protein
VSEPSEDPPAEERADDRARLQRHDEEARRPPGLGRPSAGAPSAVEDKRDLERQPDHVETLQGPGDEEGPEVVGEDESPARAGGEHCRDEQDALVAEHVAQLRKDRHDERGEQQLSRLEPVEVGVTDMEVLHQIADQWHVIPLQDTADDLDKEQVADQAEGDRAGPGSHGSHDRMLLADRAPAVENFVFLRGRAAASVKS